MTMRIFKQSLDGNVNAPIQSMSPTDVDCLSITANTATYYNIPANVDCIYPYSLKDIYIRMNATAAIPTENILTGSAPMPNPNILVLDSTDTRLSVISESSCIVYFYRWTK